MKNLPNAILNIATELLKARKGGVIALPNLNDTIKEVLKDEALMSTLNDLKC